MEKNMQKGSIYGFFLFFAFSVLFVDYKIVTPFDSGYTTEYIYVYDYIVSIIRYSVIGAFVGMFVGIGVSICKKFVS
ncbi:hypothetical protein [Alkalihalobacterium bogoriense]|uniref:hypothetical protein n=1 Tax=Alkalihalobacterium bogoriense TaxID=246272 RepID=UPI00055062D3|nr:hypothetical protein [Alkalihalobacterium bogoriense]